jgi:hypothetical protein
MKNFTLLLVAHFFQLIHISRACKNQGFLFKILKAGYIKFFFTGFSNQYRFLKQAFEWKMSLLWV